MLGKLAAAGHGITDDPANAQAIIVNTCGFISTASDEAVETILDMAEYKTAGSCKRLIATGCLAQRYKDDPDLVKSLPEVDAFLGTAACDQIVAAVEGREARPLTLFPDPDSRGFQNPEETRELISQGFAYIKVSEGCNRHCTYCIIPSLRGKQRSRPIQDICTEAVIPGENRGKRNHPHRGKHHGLRPGPGQRRRISHRAGPIVQSRCRCGPRGLDPVFIHPSQNPG